MYQNILIGIGIISIYFIVKCSCAKNTKNNNHFMFKSSYYPH